MPVKCLLFKLTDEAGSAYVVIAAAVVYDGFYDIGSKFKNIYI
jgi:hypothetical protein